MTLLCANKEEVDNKAVLICEFCKTEIDTKKIEKVFRFSYGKITHDISNQQAFKEITNSMFFHQSCVELMLGKKFNKIWKKIFIPHEREIKIREIHDL